jgi:enoyl-CoA hydratase/carnithine racemase
MGQMQTEELSLVKVQARGCVLHLSLNRPEQFNALSEQMLSQLEAQLRRAAQDPQLRVVILGAEGRAFCAGHDLKEMLGQPSLPYYQALFSKCSKVMMLIQKMPQVVIARVQGLATAAGCQLVGMCDLAVAAEDAQFAVSGVNLGLFCSTPSVALSRNVSRKQAFEMLVTGQFISAEQALARGLINAVAPLEHLDKEIERLISLIVTKPRQALVAGKSLFYQQLEMGIESAYQLAGQTMACNMMEDSALEGVQAFVDKREPRWVR